MSNREGPAACNGCLRTRGLVNSRYWNAMGRRGVASCRRMACSTVCSQLMRCARTPRLPHSTTVSFMSSNTTSSDRACEENADVMNENHAADGFAIHCSRRQDARTTRDVRPGGMRAIELTALLLQGVMMDLKQSISSS